MDASEKHTDLHHGDCTKRARIELRSCRALKNTSWSHNRFVLLLLQRKEGDHGLKQSWTRGGYNMNARPLGQGLTFVRAKSQSMVLVSFCCFMQNISPILNLSAKKEELWQFELCVQRCSALSFTQQYLAQCNQHEITQESQFGTLKLCP